MQKITDRKYDFITMGQIGIMDECGTAIAVCVRFGKIIHIEMSMRICFECFVQKFK